MGRRLTDLSVLLGQALVAVTFDDLNIFIQILSGMVTAAYWAVRLLKLLKRRTTEHSRAEDTSLRRPTDQGCA